MKMDGFPPDDEYTEKVRRQAKKEVFDDIDKMLFNKHYHKEVYIRFEINGADLEELKKRHLEGDSK